MKQKTKLLIIDDEIKITNIVKELLEDYVDEIFTANSGAEGLHIFGQHEFQCVICDIMMPGLKGTDVIKAIREKGSEVPFIFYTAFGSQELMLTAAKYGAFDFISKPDLDDLEEIVTRGIEEGFKRSQDKLNPQSSIDLEGEYNNLLDQIGKK